MRALIADPSAPLDVRVAEVDAPTPRDGQLLIAVEHVSLNAGDLNDARSGRVPAGAILGSDLAGRVEVSKDGGNTAVGTRVVALAPAAFAEKVCVDVASVAEVPDDVDLAAAAALPVAGLAALRSLRAAGPTLGRRVLITGASGGVGRFAVQLSSLAGAYVIASVGSATRGEGLPELGADEVVVGVPDLTAPVDVVLDTVGGRQMVAAWRLLSAGGSLQSIGSSSNEDAVFPPYSTVGPPKTLSSFVISDDVRGDLATLVGLLRQGSLKVEVGWRGSLERVDEAARALGDRRVRGKAVLDLPTNVRAPEGSG